jgi:hypothetical protein
MALGARQTGVITEAAQRCAEAIRRISVTPIKSALKKAVLSKPPGEAMIRVVSTAFKVSVLPKFSAANARAVQDVQAGYQHVLDAWQASPSEKHRREMLRLFARVYNARTKKG